MTSRVWAFHQGQRRTAQMAAVDTTRKRQRLRRQPDLHTTLSNMERLKRSIAHNHRVLPLAHLALLLISLMCLLLTRIAINISPIMVARPMGHHLRPTQLQCLLIPPNLLRHHPDRMNNATAIVSRPKSVQTQGRISPMSLQNCHSGSSHSRRDHTHNHPSQDPHILRQLLRLPHSHPPKMLTLQLPHLPPHHSHIRKERSIPPIELPVVHHPYTMHCPYYLPTLQAPVLAFLHQRYIAGLSVRITMDVMIIPYHRLRGPQAPLRLRTHRNVWIP